MEETLRHVRSLHNVNAVKVGVLERCYGGGQSFLLGVNEELQAVVIFYGKSQPIR